MSHAATPKRKNLLPFINAPTDFSASLTDAWINLIFGRIIIKMTKINHANS